MIVTKGNHLRKVLFHLFSCLVNFYNSASKLLRNALPRSVTLWFHRIHNNFFKNRNEESMALLSKSAIWRCWCLVLKPGKGKSGAFDLLPWVWKKCWCCLWMFMGIPWMNPWKKTRLTNSQFQAMPLKEKVEDVWDITRVGPVEAPCFTVFYPVVTLSVPGSEKISRVCFLIWSSESFMSSKFTAMGIQQITHMCR